MRELAASAITLPVISLRGERECVESRSAGGRRVTRAATRIRKRKGAASSGGGRGGEGEQQGDDDGQRARNRGRSGW